MAETFHIGQRWISDTESDLGLGTILDVEHRQITVVFMATGDTRIYAKETAPLTRVAFNVGDRVTSHADWEMQIDAVETAAGTFVYVGTRTDTGEAVRLPEEELNNFLQFRTPRDRLFAGLLDGRRWYALRQDVFEHRHRLALSPVRGLLGPRIALLPHQVYIAVEAGQRQAPRVLLADEVGLGKTIEAGMIMHSQLVNQQIARVLVLVPAALLHQWLVEMLRKFNLRFRIMDRERFDELEPSAPGGNPFLSEQLVLCTTDTLTDNTDMADAAQAAGWDMLTVDEAHHLAWTPDAASPAYTLVQALAQSTPAVLLLTATPEQLGQAGHFARLRLLDPDRFDDLDAFSAEEADYAAVAAIADKLSRHSALGPADIAVLDDRFAGVLGEAERDHLGTVQDTVDPIAAERVLERLIDRHGTGRLLFRNTRSAVPGFPQRRFHLHTLTDDSDDERLAWLLEFLASHYPHKVLLIVSRRETVKTLAAQLRIAGINTAQFHEDMSIVERDRAAAWFADPEEDCRLLLCSEIGSEGRNFQFLHHLVTFELPDAPDLLEQRIGRLDRIGQREDIEIHVPAVAGSRDALLARWYHEGLGAFESICQVGSAVRAGMAARLDPLLDACQHVDAQQIETLISETATLAATLRESLENGRDRLLEMNSNRPERIQQHLDALQRDDRDYRLQDFMSAVFDRFGVNVEDQSDSWILHPGDHMQVESFPYLPADGLTVTFQREVALRREDFTWLSWDHPMVSAAMDMILDEGYGQSDAQLVSIDTLPERITLVEGLYVLHCSAPAALGIDRYFPTTLQRHYVGIDGRDYTEQMREVQPDALIQRFDRNKLKQVILGNKAVVDTLIERTATLAEAELPEAVADARAAIDRELGAERERLEALQAINPSVRQSEIDALIDRHTALLGALDNTRAMPVAVRVLFNT